MVWQRLVTTILIICEIFNLTTGGNISIQKLGNKTGEMSYECGRNATLTCNFKKSTFAISWMNATDVIPIVKCTQNSQNKCFLTPDYEGQYRFTYDIQGTFNLTVIEITKEDNGRKLICSDGSDSDYEVIKVTDYEPLLFEDTKNGTVRAVSGCISQDTEVSFKWMKVSVSSGIEEEMIPTINGNYTRKCSNDSDCGNDQQVQYTEMISATSSDNGNYFLKVLAVYWNESKESCNTAYKYNFEEHDDTRTNNATVIGLVTGFLGVSIAILLLIGYFVWTCRKKRRKEEKEFYQLKRREQFAAQKILNKKGDTPTKPLLEEQSDSPIKKSDELKETTNHLKKDKRQQNEEDMKRKKKLFDRRHRHRHGNPQNGHRLYNMMWRALLLVLAANCKVSEHTIISPAFNDVLVNSSLELACYTNKSVTFTQWGSLNHMDTFSHLYLSDNGSCITDGFLADKRYYETSCYSNGTFKINIKRVNLSNHGQEWYCYGENRKSNIANITVQVPATEVIFDFHSNNSIYINENQIQNVSCKTSACLPKPLVKWYLWNPINNITYDITNHSTESYILKENWLTVGESILQLLPNRTLEHWQLYCAVRTKENAVDILSNELVLNVAYPPDGPPMIASYRNGSTIQVLETESLKLTCSVTGGKPLATLRMTCLNSNSTATVTKETTVTVYIALQVNRNHSQCICQSDHIISGTQKTYVMLDVLFQPREVRFGMEAGERLIVNQNEKVTFQCFAESNPHPDIVIRNQRDEQIKMTEYATHDVQHTIPKVSCADAGEYVCSARNMLTNGQGALSRLILIVRCSPRPSADTVKETRITALLHVDVTLQFLAQDFFDEQNKTAFAWYKQKVPLQNDGNKYIISSYGLQSNLIIRNITYSDYGQYQVVVRNSFGHNTYYYELLEKAPQQSTEPMTASTLFGVAVGISSFTVLVIVIAFSYWICTRRKRTLKITDRKTAEVITEYQATTGHNDNDAENVYEQIDEQCTAKGAYIDMQGIKTDKIQTVNI